MDFHMSTQPTTHRPAALRARQLQSNYSSSGLQQLANQNQNHFHASTNQPQTHANGQTNQVNATGNTNLSASNHLNSNSLVIGASTSANSLQLGFHNVQMPASQPQPYLPNTLHSQQSSIGSQENLQMQENQSNLEKPAIVFHPQQHYQQQLGGGVHHNSSLFGGSGQLNDSSNQNQNQQVVAQSYKQARSHRSGGGHHHHPSAGQPLMKSEHNRSGLGTQQHQHSLSNTLVMQQAAHGNQQNNSTMIGQQNNQGRANNFWFEQLQNQKETSQLNITGGSLNTTANTTTQQNQLGLQNQQSCSQNNNNRLVGRDITGPNVNHSNQQSQVSLDRPAVVQQPVNGAKQRVLRPSTMKQQHPATTTNASQGQQQAQTQRFFKEQTNSILDQKHSRLMVTNNQQQQPQQNLSPHKQHSLQQMKSSSNSILLPRGTIAPNHKKHLQQPQTSFQMQGSCSSHLELLEQQSSQHQYSQQQQQFQVQAVSAGKQQMPQNNPNASFTQNISQSFQQPNDNSISAPLNPQMNRQMNHTSMGFKNPLQLRLPSQVRSSGRLTSQKSQNDIMNGANSNNLQSQSQINPNVNFIQPTAQQPPQFINNFHPQQYQGNVQSTGQNGRDNHQTSIDNQLVTNNQAVVDVEMTEDYDQQAAPAQQPQQQIQVLPHQQLNSSDIQQKLQKFWTHTAPSVSLQETAEIDRPYLGDPQQVAEYCSKISKHLISEETDTTLPKPSYMFAQQDINEKMRAILVDWIIEVHLKFKLEPETLFLTVSLIDRYLQREQIRRCNLQLVGVTAMMIASKYEEIYAPEVRDFVYICDNAYTKEQIFTMEKSILTVLKFQVTFPSPYRFLERFHKVSHGNSQQWNLARYLIELPLIEQRMLKYSPSNIAASAVYLSQRIILGDQANWTNELQNETSYTEQDLRNCAKDMCILLAGIERCTLQAVRKKFSLSKFDEVALIRINQGNGRVEVANNQVGVDQVILEDNQDPNLIR